MFCSAFVSSVSEGQMMPGCTFSINYLLELCCLQQVETKNLRIWFWLLWQRNVNKMEKWYINNNNVLYTLLECELIGSNSPRSISKTFSLDFIWLIFFSFTVEGCIFSISLIFNAFISMWTYPFNQYHVPREKHKLKQIYRNPTWIITQ